jgi:hypothetical protein
LQNAAEEALTCPAISRPATTGVTFAAVNEEAARPDFPDTGFPVTLPQYLGAQCSHRHFSIHAPFMRQTIIAADDGSP